MAMKRFEKNLKMYTSNGRRRAGMFSDIRIKNVNEKHPADSDTENRKRILDEITERVSNGEDIDKVVGEIASKDEIKQQFDYYIKHGIKDLSGIFKSWYERREHNRETLQKIEFREIG